MKKIIIALLICVGVANASIEEDMGIPILYTHTSDFLYVSYDGFDIRCKGMNGKITCQELSGSRWIKSDMSDYSDDLMEVIKTNIIYVGK